MLSSFKDSASEYLLKGNNKILLGDYKAAILEFTKAIMTDPDLPHPYTSRGAAKLEIRDYEGAISDCLKAIRLHFKAEMEAEKKSLNNQKKSNGVNPIYGKLYSIIGTAKLLQGNIDDALIDLNSARLLGYNDATEILKTYGR